MIERNHKRSFVRMLAVYGCISNGLLYTFIGVIALLSFFKLQDGGADESSLMAFLRKSTAGTIIIWIIVLGLLSYISWRIYETVTDPYGYGKNAKGIARRTGILFSSIADALIAWSAIKTLFTRGAGRDTQSDAQHELIQKLIRENDGAGLIVAVGILICITAFVQFIYLFSKTYLERLDIDRLKPFYKKSISVLAWMGYCSRGIIVGITGIFFIRAGLYKNADEVVNTDKAFDFLGDHIGHTSFIVVAIGTVAYGLFMFLLGRYYDPDKD
ncbi:DUF1206 domain-containing protein [Segetibacter sp. 3557_3]|uniref:DUF1206 domain-containing protein n=1 Tax=Segetibacter sp. 3557_3 TaxID=2547429 RepID=UPI001058B947|nr:DUF1206 domain-containing protein [Segetibacter sp. 3557_3]TDH20673.1 DUF1206 domain-containing protein [Segetibacter sp. 3557_3]